MSDRPPHARDLDTLVERAARVTAADGFGRRVQSRLDDETAWQALPLRSRLPRLMLTGATTAAVIMVLLVWTPWRERLAPPAHAPASAVRGARMDRADLPGAAGSPSPVATGSSEPPRTLDVATRVSGDARGRGYRRAGTAAVAVFDRTGVSLAPDVDPWTRLRPESIHVAPIEVAVLDDHQGLEIDSIEILPIEIDPLPHPTPIGHTSSPLGASLTRSLSSVAHPL